VVVTVVADRGLVSALSVDDVLPKPLEEHRLLQALERVGLRDRGGKVLVVDDDAPSRRLLQATLSQRGYSVTCAPDGERGLALVANEPPDAVVLDLLMPGMDGFEFLQRLRAEPSNKNIPVLIWTMKNLSSSDEQRLRTSQCIVAKGSGTTAIVDELRGLIG
jgi:CheY-like chemotaxis protein